MVNKKKINKYFLTSFIFNLFIIEVSFPSLGIRGELFADVGTNFLYHARYTGVFESLLKTDTGYLPLFPRLISILVHGLFPDFYFPFIVNQITFVVVSLASAFLNLERFQMLFNNRKLTWFISVLYCFHHDYDQFALMNISYAFVPLIFFIFIRELLEPKSKLDLFCLFIVSLVFLSKAVYLSFFPALLVTLYWGLKFRQKNIAIISSVGMACLIIQIVMLMLHRNEGPYSVQDYSLIETIGVWLSYCGVMIQQSLFPLVKGAHGINLLLLVVAMGLTSWSVYEVREKKMELRVVLFFAIVLLGSAIILEKSYGIKFGDSGFGFASNRFFWDRRKLISRYAVFLLIIYLTTNSNRLEKYHRFVMPYIFIINFSILGCRIFSDRDLFRNKSQSFSNWKNDYPLTLEKNFCIPINPKGWRFCSPSQ